MHDNVTTSADDDDYKLPLRPWLKNHIDRNTFEGLEWINAKELVFKIPWTKKGHPGWEKDYEVFKCWAIHRGKYDETGPPDYNRWKGNFRSVLHKSEDFREIKEKSITNQQTGNYRVFQILPSSEVKENRKRTRTKSNEDPPSTTTKQMKQTNVVTTTSSPALTQPATSSQIDQSHVIAPFTTTYGQQTMPVSDISDPLFFDTLVTTSISGQESIHQTTNCSTSILAPHSNGANYNSEPTIDRLDVLPSFSFSDVQQCLGSDPSEPLPGTRIEVVASEEYLQATSKSTPFNFGHLDPVTSEEPTKLSEFMEKKSVSKDQLTKILLTVKYGEEVRVCQEYLDLSQGCRVVYGDASVQAEAVAANGRTIDDLTLPFKELPQYDGNNDTISESLKYAELGLVLLANESGIILAKRLCQSRIWLLKDPPLKMDRNSQIEVFSYSKYIDSILENALNPPGWQIIFTIGKKPPCSCTNLIKVILEPIAAPLIENFFSKGIPCTSSLCYSSEESSIDKMIRMFSIQSLEK